MSEIVGMLRGRKVYEDDRRLAQLQRDMEYIPVYGTTVAAASESRCEHCKRTNRNRTDCESCGAPL